MTEGTPPTAAATGVEPLDPGSGAADPPAAAQPARFHDLDALRAFAMLAGIALHAAVPFVPYWREGDPGAGFLGAVFVAIHGFRMPLFFLLSGFFTTMLWERKGTRALLRHRLKRVGLPFALAVLLILPLVPLGLLGGMALAGNPPAPADPQAEQGFRLAHLWFLWMLLLFVGLFALVATLARRLPTLPSVVTSRAVWGVALLAIAVIAQTRMTNTTLGPDTSEGVVPVPHVFVYYACFFAWGALVFGHATRGGTPLIRAMGRDWPVTLASGAAVLLLLMNVGLDRTLSAALQIAYAVLLTCALLGLAHRFFATNSISVRWMSDSSYWLYLTHLPLVLVAEGLALRWGVPPLVAFPLIFGIVTAFLLLTYRYGVRYTRIGTLLNGPRSRAEDQGLNSQARPQDIAGPMASR